MLGSLSSLTRASVKTTMICMLAGMFKPGKAMGARGVPGLGLSAKHYQRKAAQLTFFSSSCGVVSERPSDALKWCCTMRCMCMSAQLIFA
jgi:hypothetical protein